MAQRRKLAAGNWKMHGFQPDLGQVRALADAHPAPNCDVLICPPATLISRMSDALSANPIQVGGQNCAPQSSGAHTGEISAGMLADAGATYVILGHSERRADQAETDAMVCAKASAVSAAGLIPVICVGETLEDRAAGRTLQVVGTQLAGSVPDTSQGGSIVVAYEPVWAIGTGEVATTDQIAEVHDAIRALLIERLGPTAQETRLLYGGSVKPGNAAEIFATSNVDGALVGGASLKASDFGAIIEALDAS
ncbi:Triosephosphate isomerase [Candidatus Rhodobacter oscarellae]|uniref:Triosephosphate isomerase n=1 Tax=Candidatus Rhodobacter oscarellae TaxID=1675527 RepID=A0A0J9GU45_9RHOB|nr:triose-phosphate isomerase [Candidatus Rhodobacter lobularis]KMW57088.1 Triosephosphate isomerase [Candidatus Rhodobacter lobularis]